MATMDLLIRRGTVVDGTGRERRVADVAVGSGRVVGVGDFGSTDAKTVIDAEGLVVAPGFLDLHTHYDAQIFWDPYCTATGWHGVTTVHVTNCGFGLAPLPKELHDRGFEMMTRTEQIAMACMREGVPFDWETYPEWLDSLRRTPKGVNVGSCFPLNPAMFTVMGAEAAKKRSLSNEEVNEIKVLLGEALDAGAVGLSVSTKGGHNNHTDFDGSQLPMEYVSEEIICALAEVLRDRDRGFIQLLTRRSDSVDDLEFAASVAAAGQRPLLYNAISASAPTFSEVGVEGQLRWLDTCAGAGLPVFGQGAISRTWVDYTMEDFNMFDIVPVWARATRGSLAEKLANLTDPAIRAEMKQPENFDHIDWSTGTYGPQNARVTDVRGHQSLKKYERRLIGDIARDEGRHPVDVFLDIVCETKLTAEFTSRMPGWDPEQVARIARHPRVAYGLSDGGAHSHTVCTAGFPTEALTWLVRESGLIPLEEAHAKLSALPAQIVGYTDRGTLEPGKAADIVVYDYDGLRMVPELAFETLHDQPAGEWRKVQRAEGYRYTIVNGQVTLVDGEPTGNLPGQLLSLGSIS